MLSTQKVDNQNDFDEGYPCDNPGLARLSYVIKVIISRTFAKCERHLVTKFCKVFENNVTR